MPKRRAVTDSESEDNSGSSQLSKRARTGDFDATATPEPQVQQKGKGRARRNHEEEEEEEEDVDGEVENMAPNADEEKQFEEENEEKIRAKVMGKSKTQGGIAEMGIIEKLEMHQFMCHKYLTFSFGPQINFIIGHNGSGKSAVLSALTVALGGKATTTGRGSGLKSFIREGQTTSEVSVTIKNQGEEAFKHDEYGDSIVITRRFNKDGQSSYKIKSKDGRVISTKREELAAICDHMNIQVDNPMNILTQDSARQFLSASAPADKYKFFLRGTQLSQLSEEYSTCLANVTQTQKILAHKAEAIPDLEFALQEAVDKFEEAAKAREQRHKADELKKELAWAHVAQKEAEMTDAIEKHAKIEAAIAKLEEKLKQADASLASETETVTRYEAELDELGDIQHLIDQKERLEVKIKENKKKLQDLQAEAKQMNKSMKTNNEQNSRMEHEIQVAQAKLDAFNKDKRDETNRKLEEANVEYEAARKISSDLTAQMDLFKAKGEAAKAENEKLKRTREDLRNQVDNCLSQINACAEREKNRLAPFGRNLDRVFAEIDRTNWAGQKPVGPFGMFVNVKDGDWANLMRVQIGGFMTSFAVTDPRDRAKLDYILKQNGNHNVTIFITDVDLFDYSSGEPPAEYRTVLRVLDITQPFVLRVLINQTAMERTFVAKTRQEADRLLMDYGQGGVAWTADLYRVTRFREGGGQGTLLNGLRQGDSRHQFFTGGDASSDRRKWQLELERLNGEIQEIERQMAANNGEYRTCVESFNSIQAGQYRQAQLEERRLKNLRDSLQEEANEELPRGVQGLQQSLQEMQDEKDNIKKQFEENQIQQMRVNETQTPLVVELKQVKESIANFDLKRDAIAKKITDAVTVRLSAQNNKVHYEKKLATEKENLENDQVIVEQLETEFQNWTDKALQYCERYPNPRSVEDVQRNLQSVQNALKEREKRHGASVEEMTVEVNKRKQALDTARKEISSMLKLNKKLKKSIRIRLRKWHEFRRHIALRCKVYFSYHLSQRGYYGKVLFDHINGTLTLKVQTDDLVATQNNREKDPRSLSGGEKSFSTICLLLSLWESIGCPIRCLDEFDVFMDAVNRRISMKMMIETANASDRKQYILITPQDMNSIRVGPTVRVHRMTDPERGQGILR
ncbi:P-loop containing nucleoside triphosphate hydrolase protein [Abortiporus biennis]|nr:P-loop containing nucleoside triphosphate hydrolase protein [Abortiporus biennis]